MAQLYKIILVDDEDEVRGRISSKISEESGFVVVATAGNGYDALELIEKLEPDVVLTDIKMPFINGLELAAMIRREHPAVKIGFITGYDEFDYAREAIALNACSYLTKPLTQEDISTFLHTLKIELDDEYREHYNREQMRLRYEKSIPLVIENCFVSFLASGSQGASRDLEQLRQNGISLDEGRYLLLFVMVERNPESWSLIEHEQLRLSVRDRLSGLLRLDELDHYHFMFNEGLVYIIKEKKLGFDRQLDELCNRMVQTSEQFLSVRISIGVSALHQGFRLLGTAYDQACKALSLGRFGGLARIAYFDQTEVHTGSPPRFQESDGRNLEHVLRFGDSSAIINYFAELSAQVSSSRWGPADAGVYAISIVGILARHAASVNMDLNELAGGGILDTMMKLRDFGQLFSWCSAIVARIHERGEASRMKNAERLLERAENYVIKNYSNPELTMDTVCESLGVSASYLTQLFKKYKGSSFVKSVTQVRMQKAIELLSTTGELIVEVALRCGYRDVYYFSHSFKKFTGVPPKKYREDHA